MDENQLTKNLKVSAIEFKRFFNLEIFKKDNLNSTLKSLKHDNLNLNFDKPVQKSPEFLRPKSELKTPPLKTTSSYMINQVGRIKDKMNAKEQVSNVPVRNSNKVTTLFIQLKGRPQSCQKVDEYSLQNFNNEASTSTDCSVFRGRIDDYIIGKEIGKGAYATVKKVIHKPTNMRFAMKIYAKINLVDQHRKNSVKREIETLKRTDHTNIVKLHEIIECPKTVRLP